MKITILILASLFLGSAALGEGAASSQSNPKAIAQWTMESELGKQD